MTDKNRENVVVKTVETAKKSGRKEDRFSAGAMAARKGWGRGWDLDLIKVQYVMGLAA